MKVPVLSAAALGTAFAVGIGLAGCSGDKSTALPSPTASPSADYSALMIKASDITQPADFITNAPPTGFTTGAPTTNPSGKPGIAGVFKSQDGSRQISDTVVVLADATAAKSALDAAVAGIGSSGQYPNSAVVFGGRQRHAVLGVLTGSIQERHGRDVHPG